MQIDSSIIDKTGNDMHRVINQEGQIVSDGEPTDLWDEELVGIYEDMVFARHFDERAVSLQRQGRLGTYPPVAGHEAAQIGSTFALRKNDWILSTYRESAIGFARGVPPVRSSGTG
jgi:pyruvate dehydrogenase E1 component alpha subunit